MTPWGLIHTWHHSLMIHSYVTWLISLMTPWWLLNASLVTHSNVTSLIHVSVPPRHIANSKLTCGAWRIHMWDMPHPYVISLIHVSVLPLHVVKSKSTCGLWRIHMWDMTHSYGTWLIQGHHSFMSPCCLCTLRIVDFHVKHTAFTCGTRLTHLKEWRRWVKWLVHTSHEWVMSRMNESCPTYECVMPHMWRDVWTSHVTYVCLSHAAPALCDYEVAATSRLL